MSSNANQPDRRVLRTRRTLREALLTLILERGWDAISVQDVCDRADVGRSTFYTHFADKEDLLLSGFDDLRKLLRRTAPGAPLGFVRDMAEHVRENQRLFRALVGKRSGQVVQTRFRELVIDLIREDLAGLAPAGPQLDGAARYLGGALVELLLWSLDARRSLEPLAAAELFLRLSTPVLAAIRSAEREPPRQASSR